MQRFSECSRNLKHDTRIAPGEPINHGGNEARGQIGIASDPHFPGGRVSKKFEVLYRLSQLIEHSYSAIEQDATVFGRLNSLRIAIEEMRPYAPFQFRDLSGNDGLRGVQ